MERIVYMRRRDFFMIYVGRKGEKGNGKGLSMGRSLHFGSPRLV